MPDLTKKALNIADMRTLARRRLSRGIFEYIDRGTEDEIGINHNQKALKDIKLRPRVLVDVSQRATGIELFGRQRPLPLVIAPTGTTGQVWYKGETALARAAARAGIPFTLSNAATTPLEEVIADAGGTPWFQLYVWTDREASYKAVARAEAAGYEALVVTVDNIIDPNREFNIRNDFMQPFRFTARNVVDGLTSPRWLFGTVARYVLDGGLPKMVNVPTEVTHSVLSDAALRMKSDALGWDDLRRLREMWPRPLIVKGIVHPDDARRAADLGADGVVVSNHGGMVSDATMATIDALPDIVAAVGDRMTVLVDSGFRRGSDVVKALALGADAVMIGRATLYGVAAAGEAGALRAIAILGEEIRRVMGILGCADIASIGAEHVVRPPANADTTQPRVEARPPAEPLTLAPRRG
jgi:isopentenyl diphosphate isomerase/L-lactate dehydrogenase-like FMN-dependent dehydrogenase